MEVNTDLRVSNALHEEIVMQNTDLPINFIEHNYDCVGPYCILHWHNELELVYVKKGVVSVGCKSGRREAAPGSLIFINSNEPHDYSIVEAPIQLYCCTVSLYLLQSRYMSSYDLRFFPASSNMTVFKNIIDDDPEIVDMFLKMWDEGHRQEIGYEYAIKSHLYGILSQMIRHHVQSTLSQKHYLNRCQSLNNINKVIDYIVQNYHNDISLDELADLLCVNRFYFCRLFKEATGSTPVEYINRFRTHQAIAMMMEHPDYSITHIATSVGYNDSNYFARVFKTATGDSPSVYKANLDSRSENQPNV